MLLDECPDPQEAGEYLTGTLVAYYQSADIDPDELLDDIMFYIDEFYGPERTTLH